MEKNMTQGNPMKLILTFAVPILLGSVVQQFYNLADTMIVGRKLGSDALASVGATGAIVSLLFSLAIGFCNGFSISISQYFGAKRDYDMKKAVAMTYLLGMVIVTVVSLIAYFIMPGLLRLLATPEEIMEDALLYVRIVVIGLPITMLYNIFNAILKAVGNSVAPLVFLGLSAVINVGMDFLFIYGFKLGIPGAAIATVIAQTLSVICCFVYVIKKAKILHVKPEHFKLDFQLIGKMMTMGLSMAMMFGIVATGSVILQSGINGLGKDIIAAHTAGRKILEVIMNPIASIGAATATFTGQNYGAGEGKRIKRGTFDGVLLTAIWSTFIIVVTYLFAPQLVSLIIDKESSSPEIIAVGVKYLKISCPFFYALGVLVVIRNVLQGIGQRIVPIIASIIEMGGKILVVFLLVPKIEYTAICIAEPSIWVIGGILVLVVFLASGVGKIGKESKKIAE